MHQTLPENLRRNAGCLTITLALLGSIYYSIVPLMVKQWYDASTYSHGFLVPVIAGGGFHEFAGLAVFGLALALLIGCSILLRGRRR
ncbi:MAG: hypothetical protein AB1805_15145 [Nitrospirota bacterium]